MEFPDLLVQEVDFTGGEPLLRRDWPLIAERLIERGIATNVLTNGLALGGETVSRMKEVGISGVGISLDGLEDTHDVVRSRPGSYGAVLRSIGLLQNAGVAFNVITTVNRKNLPELPGLLNVLRSLGVEHWRLQPLIPMGRVLSHADLQLDGEGLLQLGLFIREHRDNGTHEPVHIICSDGLEYVEERPGDRPWRGCSAGVTACGIRSDGKVTGCLSMPGDVVEGDLRERSLWNIWFDTRTFSYTRSFTADQLGHLCRGCVKALECKGGCSSSSFCSSGLFHNDALCFFREVNPEAANPSPPESRVTTPLSNV